MLRQSKDDEVLDRSAEVASAIAEEGLRYVSDSSPGCRRKRAGTSFSYYDTEGKRIPDAAVIRRIKLIGIPPAYESVWICPSSNMFRQPASKAEAKRNVVGGQATRQHAGYLSQELRPPGNPQRYMSGDLVKMIDARIARKFKRQYAKLNADEVMVLAFLHKRLDAMKGAA